MDNNTKYQKALLYITLVLLAVLYIGITAAAYICYLPYSYNSVISGDMFKTVWSFMIFPVIAVSLTLFMANILNRRLKNITVIFVLVGMLFFSLVALIYGKYDYTVASYFTSPIAFLLISAISSCIIWDMWGGRRANKKIFWLFVAFIVLAIFLFGVYLLINYTVLTDLLGHAMLLTLVPIFCALCFVFSAISALSSVFSKLSTVLCFAVSAYGVMYIAFPFMYHRPLRILFTVGVILCAVTGIYDVIKFITYKEKKENDR